MKRILRLALLLLCVSSLLFLSYKMGITGCGPCFNHTNLFRDVCKAYEYPECDYTVYIDQMACCRSGSPPQGFCNTHTGSTIFEFYDLSGQCEDEDKVVSACLDDSTCNNPNWSYTSYNSCSMGAFSGSGTIYATLCN